MIVIDTHVLIWAVEDDARLGRGFHADPADRPIIATARDLGRPLLTTDLAILRYGAAGHVSVRAADQ